VLDSGRFPGANADGAGTIGAWFGQNSQREALSQINGNAIWIRFDNWSGATSSYRELFSGSISRYGLGTLMHELLHKNHIGGGFSHTAMQNALMSVGAGAGSMPADGRNMNSLGMASICF
jgi:hypothetical protein